MIIGKNKGNRDMRKTKKKFKIKDPAAPSRYTIRFSYGSTSLTTATFYAFSRQYKLFMPSVIKFPPPKQVVFITN